MLRRCSLLALLAACSPSSPAPRCPAPASPPVVEVSAAPSASAAPAALASAAPASSPAARARPPGRCWARGRPAPVAQNKKDDSPFCDAFDAAELARVEARIRKEFTVRNKPSKLVVDFGCDEAYGSAREVVFEDGSGHGGSLRLSRMQRDEQRVLVRQIAVQHYHRKGIEVRTAELDLAAFDAALAGSRVAMLARPHLIRLAVPRGVGGMSFSFSSHDFHLRLSILDDGGRVTERGFTGYESSAEQERYLPMRLAAEPIEKLLAKANFRGVEATDDDRRWFTGRLLHTLDGDPGWWVRERYVAAAASLATVDAVPALAALVARKGDASVERTREGAIAAIAAITGWDPRVDEAGAPRTAAEAAAAVARECELSPVSPPAASP